MNNEVVVGGLPIRVANRIEDKGKGKKEYRGRIQNKN